MILFSCEFWLQYHSWLLITCPFTVSSSDIGLENISASAGGGLILSGKFLQPKQQQFSPHRAFAWKHLQYFLRHADLWQLHSILCVVFGLIFAVVVEFSAVVVVLVEILSPNAFLPAAPQTVTMTTLANINIFLLHHVRIILTNNFLSRMHSDSYWKSS